MKVSVTARHGQLSDDVQQAIHQKVQKLPRYLDRTTAIDVVVDLERTEAPKVEVKVTVEESSPLVAADSATSVMAALDSVIDKLQRQLTRQKEKLTDHRNKRV